MIRKIYGEALPKNLKHSIGLDSSVILRLILGTPEKQFVTAQNKIKTFLAEGRIIFVSDLVVSEVYFALQYHFEVPKKEILSHLKKMFASNVIRPMPGSVCLDVIERDKKCKAGFVDQMINQQYNQFSEKTITFDKSMKILENVEVL